MYVYRSADPLGEEDAPQTIYECEVCTQIFPTKKDFLTHHMSQFGSMFSCCRCDAQFRNTANLYHHYEMHKNGLIAEGAEESVDVDYSENVEAVMNIPNEPIGDTNELLYILDGSQCINEVVIDDEEIEIEDESEERAVKPENFTIVQVEHGYMLPSVFKGQLEAKRRYRKRNSDLIVEHVEGSDLLIPVAEETEVVPQSYTALTPKPRPKRRHEVPDFSATNYIILNPNEEVDIPHYKCLRCEQLFISKFTFFRHIEKGKCFINSCDACTASFAKNSEFYEHYLAEHTDRAICNFCFRTFMYEKNVKEHMLRHLDQFRHRCEECNKGFYTVREYRNHYKNRHMGIRHKCDVCGRSFADEYYFKRHVATHQKSQRNAPFLGVHNQTI